MPETAVAGFVSLGDRRNGPEYLGSPGRDVWRTFFLNPPAGMRAPQAFLIEYGPGVVLQTHFHDVDEFQVVVEGDGRLGRHLVAPCTVHHARAWTPYGPIVAGPHGLSFLTLRAQRDSAGPRKLPEQRAALEAAPGRTPWQASCRFELPTDPLSSARVERALEDASGPLAEWVRLPAGAMHDVEPAPGGAFVALLRGSLQEEPARGEGLALAFLPGSALPLRLTAGADGAAALVLRFRADDGTTAPMVATVHADAWHCSLCGSVYDPRVGDPSSSLPPGTPWEAVPHDWRCPDCDAARSAFEPAPAA